MINLTADISGLEQAKQILSRLPGKLDKAVKASRSRALQSMRAEAVRKAQEVYTVKATTVRRTIALYPGTGQMRVRGTRMSLGSFWMKPTTPPRRRKNMRGLDVMVKRAGGIKHIDSAFLIRGQNSGKALPMQRIGRARNAIRALISPAVPQMLGSDEVSAAILERGQAEFMRAMNYWATRAAN